MPAAGEAKRPAYAPAQVGGRPQPRSNAVRTAQAHGAAKSSSKVSQLWKTVTVAFQGPQQWGNDVEPETMPLPNGGYEMGQVYGPYLSSPGGCADGTCSAYGEPGCGCDQVGCGTACGESCGCGCGGNCSGGCGCGDGVCGCEPSCGCPPGGACSCGSGGGCDCGCGGLCLGWGDSESCHTIRVRVPKWQELTFFGGVQGFKGPYDRDRDSGNFGFNEGFNVGFKVPFVTMGYQIGYRAVHSQLSGDKDTNIADPHTQQFVTAGIFQRVKDGIQWGLVWDMLRDERFRSVDFHQIRSELSFINRGCHEFGLALSFHLNDHEVNPDDDLTIYQASDQYLLFYRFHGYKGGEGRFYGGFNDDSDGIIGADLTLPLEDRWSLASGFTYLIPEERGGSAGASQEAWNVGVSLIWHWDGRARKGYANCYRPLFNVADNGYLIVDQRLGDDD